MKPHPPQPPGTLSSKDIVRLVMSGKTVTLPVVQFPQFLYECDEDRLEFVMECRQDRGLMVLTKWELSPSSTLE